MIDLNSTEVHCPRLFDGWACINATKAGESAHFKCPPFHDHNPQRKCHSIYYDSIHILSEFAFLKKMLN